MIRMNERLRQGIALYGKQKQLCAIPYAKRSVRHRRGANARVWPEPLHPATAGTGATPAGAPGSPRTRPFGRGTSNKCVRSSSVITITRTGRSAGTRVNGARAVSHPINTRIALAGRAHISTGSRAIQWRHDDESSNGDDRAEPQLDPCVRFRARAGSRALGQCR